MSYLLENSLVVTKEEFEENENLYLDYDNYEIDSYFILTQNDKAFFSIYDIAHFCKKKFKNDKLFVVVHRYKNTLSNINVTEFYIFNTIDIFEKSLTSFLTVEDKHLIAKQKVIQDNIKLAQQLTHQKKIHVILGDNIKRHEVLEYLAFPYSNDEIVMYSDYEFDDNLKDLKYADFLDNYVNTTLISKIINKVRIIEPKNTILKRTGILAISVLIAFVIAQDTTDDLFLDDLKNIKKETRKVNKKLNKTKNDYRFVENIYNKKLSIIKTLRKKDIFEKSEK